MKTIVLLLDSDLTHSMRIMGGVQNGLSDAREIRLAPLHFDQAETLERLLATGGVDGVIGAFLGDRWLERISKYAVPLVNIGSISDIKTVPSVSADYAAAGALAARYFRDNGWKYTAVIHERAAYASRRMSAGFVDESEKYGGTPTVLPPEILTSDTVRMRNWLASLPDPVGCFCTSDFLARQVARDFAEIGRLVPESAGIIGVGDSLLDSVLSPITLSTITIPEQQIGRAAARMLLSMLDAPGTRPTSIELPPERILVRQTTAIARHPDDIVNKALAHIASNLFSPCGTEELARTCGASKRSLEMRFKATLGRPPAAEWRARRHREVCRLLAETNIPLKDIAEMAGAAEPANFWNAFRKTEGTTPAKYRIARTEG